MTRTSCASVLVLIAISAACGTNPAAPTAMTSSPPPTVSQDVSRATLVIRDFSVTEWYDQTQGRFHYWPKLTVAETSGASLATISDIVFELLGVGPTGQVRPALGPFVVPAGGTVNFVEDDYGPWLEIDSTANASRVRSCSLSSTATAATGRSARSPRSRDSRVGVERRPSPG
jgi:hypothetical protein